MLRRGLTKDLLIILGFLMDEVNSCSFRSQMQRLHCDGWYQRSSLGPTVSRLLSVGEIEKVERKGNIYYRLTSRGSEKIKEEIPLLKLAEKPWDGSWRIVIFDIPEKKRFLRDALREKLLLLGFGKWQESVYLNPHQIEQEMKQYLTAKGLSSYGVCLTAKRADLGNNRELANSVWHLDKINQNYEDFISDCRQFLTGEKKENQSKEINRLWLFYKDLITHDPYLPKELLPERWLAQKAKLTLKELLKRLTNKPTIVG